MNDLLNARRAIRCFAGWLLLALGCAPLCGQGFVEDLAFRHRPEPLRSGVFFNDRFASNRWRTTDPDPPAVPSSHYAYFSERYIAGEHEATKAFGMWQYACLATNGVAQGDYAGGKAAFLAYLRNALASPGTWLAADCARKSRRTVFQVSLMPWYLSESSDRTLVEPPILHAHRRMYTSQSAYRDLVEAYAYELITATDWTDRVRYWEGPINEPQRYWRGSLAQLSQLYRDFAQAVEAAESLAEARGLSTGDYRIGGTSPAAWWMAITVTDSPPGPLGGPDPGPPNPLVEINRRLIEDHLLDPQTPLDFVSWHQVGTSAAISPDGPYPGLPETGFGGVRPGWCSTAMRVTRSWVTSAGGDPDSIEYLLTEWYNAFEGAGQPPGIYAAVVDLNARANIARNDLGGAGFALATRTVWEDWANVPAGDDSGPGLYHKVGRRPKPALTIHQAVHAIGGMAEVHVDHANHAAGTQSPGAAIYGRTGNRYRLAQGSGQAWTLRLRSRQTITISQVTRLDGTTAWPGRREPPPPPGTSISISAAAWEVLIVDFALPVTRASCTLRNGNGSNPTDFTCVTTPILGTDWITDFRAPGGSTTTILAIGLAGPATGPGIGRGEFLIGLTPAPITLLGTGPIVTAVPNHGSLLGLRLATQGFRIDPPPGGEFVPLNALDVVLGL